MSNAKAAPPDSPDLLNTQVAGFHEYLKLEYEYARSEIHLRLGFNRSILQMQVALLIALVGGMFSEHFHNAQNNVFSIIAFGGLVLNGILLTEIRSNRVHMLIFGNFIRFRLYPFFPTVYEIAAHGGVLGTIRDNRERVNGYYPFTMNSYMLICIANTIASAAVFAGTTMQTFDTHPVQAWLLGFLMLGALAFIVIQLRYFMLSDPMIMIGKES